VFGVVCFAAVLIDVRELGDGEGGGDDDDDEQRWRRPRTDSNYDYTEECIAAPNL